VFGIPNVYHRHHQKLMGRAQKMHQKFKICKTIVNPTRFRINFEIVAYLSAHMDHEHRTICELLLVCIRGGYMLLISLMCLIVFPWRHR
jgi:hypothetical protein